MINREITNFRELHLVLMEVEANKLKQEELLKKNLSEIKDKLNPVSAIKSLFNGTGGDGELRNTLFKTGLGIGARFIVRKLIGSNKSVKRHVAATFLERLIDKYVK